MMTFAPSLEGAFVALVAFGIPLMLFLIAWGAVVLRRAETRAGRNVGLALVIMMGLVGGLALYHWLFWRVPYEVRAIGRADLSLKLVIPDRTVTLGAGSIASIREVQGAKMMGTHLEIRTVSGARYLTPAYASHEPNAGQADMLIGRWESFISAAP